MFSCQCSLQQDALGRPGKDGATIVRRSARTPDTKFPGGHRGRVTPVPIPNTEVKTATADGTACEGAWESRSLPGFFHSKPRRAHALRGFFVCGRNSLLDHCTVHRYSLCGWQGRSAFVFIQFMRVVLRLATAVATILVLVVGVMPAAARPAKNLRDRQGRTIRFSSNRVDAVEAGSEHCYEVPQRHRDVAATDSFEARQPTDSQASAPVTPDSAAVVPDGPRPYLPSALSGPPARPAHASPRAGTCTPSSDRAPPAV